MAPSIGVDEECVQPLAQQLIGCISEFGQGGRVRHLDHAVRVQGEDGVGRTFDHSVVAGILPLAQHPLALRRHRHVSDLHEAVLIRLGSDRADCNVVDEVQSRPGLQRKQSRMKHMRQHTGGAELQGVGERLETLPDRVLIYADDGEAALEQVSARGLRPLTSLVRRSSLEDVFLRLTGRSLVD